MTSSEGVAEDAPVGEEPVPDAVRASITGLSTLAGAANVIMQLAWLPIGHGVALSTVDSGRLDKRPLKRTRTTFSYVMVAMLGTEHERAVMRAEVGRQHRHVHSAPGDAVKYNAFDRDLQLWVAACLAWGAEDLYLRLYGEPDPAEHDALYRHLARFGTTLQVPEDMWPADRAAFAEYWEAGLAKVEMDDTTRTYLNGFARLDFLPWPFRTALGPLNLFFTTGFLPQRFRDEMGLDWTPRQQSRFDRVVRTAAALNRALPRPAREFPWNLYWWDLRRRIRTGRPIV
ncbi:MAG TPA: oxygenase MpaB family protein [Streptosporangiaceae bacterium]